MKHRLPHRSKALFIRCQRCEDYMMLEPVCRPWAGKSAVSKEMAQHDEGKLVSQTFEAARSMPLTLWLSATDGLPSLAAFLDSLWLTLKMYWRYCLVALSMPLPEMPCTQTRTSLLDKQKPCIAGFARER